MSMLELDFETKSPVNLPAYGAYVYASDPETEVLCMAYKWGHDAPAQLWTPDKPFPAKIKKHIEQGGILAAHNAAFERLIFWYVICPDFDCPEPAIEQFYCTASLARARGLPGKLELVSALLGGTVKDHRGTQLIKECCIPPYNTELLPELYDYCLTDVEAESDFAAALPPLTASEQAQYWASEHVNDRGIRVDLEFCRAATEYKDEEVEDISVVLSEITDGEITAPTQTARITEYITSRAPRDCLRSKTTKSGWTTGRTALEMLLHEESDVPEDVRKVAQARLDGANVSVAKYKKMARMAGEDEAERIRGAFMFNTAITGRYSSTGAQLHNFPREVPENAPELMDDVKQGYELETPMKTLAGLLRPSLVPAPGRVFVGGDWSAIEAMLTPWFASTYGGNAVVKKFADGLDIYVEQADAMGQEDRQIGKVAVLACGFGGMGNAFVSMGLNYGLRVSYIEGQKYAQLWRNANQWAPAMWRALEKAAICAIRSPGERFYACRVEYMMWGKFLCCLLPSGRVLYYYGARLVDGKFDDPAIAYHHATYIANSNVEHPPLIRTWGGKLCENIVQAAAADILRETIVQCEVSELAVVGHVHDEILCEAPSTRVNVWQDVLEETMLDGPAWAEGLPLKVEMWTGDRYQK